MNKQPYVGQPVHYIPAKPVKVPDPQNTGKTIDHDLDKEAKSNSNDDGPIAAVVTRCFGDGGPDLPCVNLTIFPDQGSPIVRSSVQHVSNGQSGAAGWRYTEEQ
jgi:hypothetical protein